MFAGCANGVRVPRALCSAQLLLPEPMNIPTPTAGPVRAPLLRVFRHRSYRLFFAGQLVSLMGTWMQSVAQGWLVYRLTDSAVLLGVVAFASQVPVLFFSMLGGALADRADKRRVLMATQALSMFQAALLAVLTLTGTVEVWHIVALAASIGLINAVDIPTRQAFTIEMVGRDDLRHAIALNSIMFNIARIAGPGAAGVLVALAGEGVCFAYNAFSYAAVLVSLVAMRLPVRPRRAPSSPLEDLKAGFAYVRGNPRMRTVLLLLAASGFFGGPYLALMPVFARDVLAQGAEGLGFLMAAVGTGALLGAYAMTRVPDRFAAFAPVLSAALFGAGLVVFSNSGWYELSLVLLVPTAFGLMLQGATTNSLVQHLADEDMRGRVMSFFAMAFIGMMPWGSLALGALAEALGVGTAVTLGGTAVIAAAALAHWSGHLRPGVATPADPAPATGVSSEPEF